jgi:hypothetical protein
MFPDNYFLQNSATLNVPNVELFTFLILFVYHADLDVTYTCCPFQNLLQV